MADKIWRDYPLLLISHGESIERHIIYNVSENRYHILKFPALNNKKVLGSNHGWLVLVGHHNNQCCLFNPITMDIIELPRLKNACWYYQCVLTNPPNEPDCHILFNGGCDISFCRIGDEEFVTLSYREEDYHYLMGMGYFRGQIYGYMMPGDQFVTIHFVENTLEFTPIKLAVDDGDGSHPSLIPLSFVSFDIWFIESPQSYSDGAVELLIIYKIYLTEDVKDGLNFRVFRINTDQNSGTEIVDIDKRIIFLSHNGCGYCCNAVEGIKPNSIYYTNPHMSRDKNMHIFDLKDKSTTSQLPSRAVGRHSFTSWVHITN